MVCSRAWLLVFSLLGFAFLQIGLIVCGFVLLFGVGVTLGSGLAC